MPELEVEVIPQGDRPSAAEAQQGLEGQPPGVEQAGESPAGERWHRADTANGIPYYLDHEQGQTQWEHPKVLQLFKTIEGLNDIKYATYRTAMKLRAIQKLSNLNSVNIHMLKTAFAELGLEGAGLAPSASSSTHMSVPELEVVLRKVFGLAQQVNPDLNTAQCTELSLNWILKCFDSGRTGRVGVCAVQAGLVTLCHCTLEEKYSYMFERVCGGRVGLSHSSMNTLLRNLLLLPQLVSESKAFSAKHVQEATESCWNTEGVEPTNVVSKLEFMRWAMKEPFCLVWIPTLHRLASAETVKHEAKCAVCKTLPIIGFRYRCLKCANTDLCQNCFWTQKTVRDHKVTHPTKEYCLATSTSDDLRDFAKMLRNKITRRYRRKGPKRSYLSYPLVHGGRERSLQQSEAEHIHTNLAQLAARLRDQEGRGEGGGEDGEGEGGEEGGGEGEKVVEGELFVRTPHHSMAVEDHHRMEEWELDALRRENQLLGEELAALKAQLKQEQVPRIIKVPVPTSSSTPWQPLPPPSSLTTPPHHPHSYSHPSIHPSLLTYYTSLPSSYQLGAEAEELEALVQHLVALPTSEAMACDLDHPLLEAATKVGVAIEGLVGQVELTQEM